VVLPEKGEEQTMRGGYRSTTWQKGCVSPNPGGRPKALHDLLELARQHAPEAIETLVKIMRNDNHPQQGWAADKLLDRGWGRPIVPTVQTTTGKTFEEWLDTLDEHAKQLIDEDIARERGELADVEPNGSASPRHRPGVAGLGARVSPLLDGLPASLLRRHERSYACSPGSPMRGRVSSERIPQLTTITRSHC
jgi:hypothetical protein